MGRFSVKFSAYQIPNGKWRVVREEHGKSGQLIGPEFELRVEARKHAEVLKLTWYKS